MLYTRIRESGSARSISRRHSPAACSVTRAWLPRTEPAKRRTRERQQHAFHQQLSDQGFPRRADSQAHRHFFLTRNRHAIRRLATFEQAISRIRAAIDLFGHPHRSCRRSLSPALGPAKVTPMGRFPTTKLGGFEHPSGPWDAEMELVPSPPPHTSPNRKQPGTKQAP